ncbi:hypothetical protein [Streptomyces griseorubiginosus]|uniref:hypothetical protein n=1 Tax=Streptomyces griseorubiginosus TaxID=67304 RepID=UPI00331CCEB4
MATAPRKTSSRKPGATRAASRPASRREDAEELEVTPAEAQEAEAEGQYITVELCGEDVQIVPPTAWRTSWQRLLNNGQIDAFAEKVFHPDDFELFLELDPTMEEWIDFTERASRMAGESLGNSRGPAQSSRRTRRR